MTIGKIVGVTKTNKCVVVTLLVADKFTVGEKACVAFVNLDDYVATCGRLGEVIEISYPNKGVCVLLSKI